MKMCGREIRIQGSVIRIASLAADKHEFLDEPSAVIRGLQGLEIRVDLFTFMQKLSETSPKYDYPMEWDNLAVLPISTFEQWWIKQIDSKTRNMIRKAEKKGVELREVSFDDTLVEGIRAIYNECPVRQGKPFVHYGKDSERLRSEAGTFLDRSIFIGAFFESNLIGFIKMVTDENRAQASLMHIISMVRHRDKAPTNALIAQAVRSCAERKIPNLLYSNFTYGRKQQDTLSDFKAHNGFHRLCLPRYYVPLTFIGRVAFRLGLHHRLVDYLPETLLVRLREFRDARNNRKLSVSGSS